MTANRLPEIGDWVAFYREARVVIAEVRYVVPACHAPVLTDMGPITTDAILEVRKHER